SRRRQLLRAVGEAPLRGLVDGLCVRLHLAVEQLERRCRAGDLRLRLVEPLDGGAVPGRRQRDVLESLAVPLGPGELSPEILVGKAHVEADGLRARGVEL